jgi:hypothetical protein
VPKLKAHVLLSALVISIIISIIISSLLLLHYHSNLQWTKFKMKERLQRNLQSATNIVIADTVNFNDDGEERLDLFGDRDDSVSIIKESWGVFNVAKIKSFYQNQSLHKNFFFGTELNDKLNACLYLVDHKRPVQISGSTNLVGNAYLPSGGIKTAYIDGKGYNGKELISAGTILRSDTTFPTVNKILINKLYEIFKITRNNDFQNSNAKVLADSIYNSFENDVQYYFVSSSNQLTAKNIHGKVILFSDSLIKIKAGTTIEDAIIIAPEILIEDSFEGSVQLIANKVIKIGKHCKLKYPSSILLLKDSVNTYQGQIEIADSTAISGILFANAINNDLYKNIVELKKGSVFEGVVYVHGYLQPAGAIYGTVVTDYFLYKSIITTYENSLVDVVIDRSQLSKYFIVSTLIKAPGKLKIIKWLK